MGRVDPWFGLGWVEIFHSFWWVGLGPLLQKYEKLKGFAFKARSVQNMMLG